MLDWLAELNILFEMNFRFQDVLSEKNFRNALLKLDACCFFKMTLLNLITASKFCLSHKITLRLTHKLLWLTFLLMELFYFDIKERKKNSKKNTTTFTALKKNFFSFKNSIKTESQDQQTLERQKKYLKTP